MAYQPIINAFRLSGEEAGGQPSYMDALLKGFKGAQEAVETAYKPKNMAEALMQAQLKNAHDRTINKYLDPSENARIGSSKASSGLSNLKIKQLRNQMQSDQALNDLLSGKSSSTPSHSSQGTASKPQGQYGPTVNEGYDNSDRNVSVEGPGIPASLSAKDVFPGRQPAKKQPAYAQNISSGMNKSKENIVTEGNPSLKYINDLYDNHPELRDNLKKRGYIQTQTTKYDPKTGITSIVTTKPNGEVSIKTLGIKSNNGNSPLTTKTLSAFQSAKTAIPQLKRVIDKLIASPSPAHLPYGIPWRPGALKEHEDLVNLGKDLFAKAKGLTTTEKALATGAETLERGAYSSDASYHEALRKTKALLDLDEKEIDAVINSGVVTTSKEESKKNDPLGIR